MENELVGMKVAKVCNFLDISRKQLMDWEKAGLLGDIPREVNPDSGNPDRVYGPEQIKILKFIKALRETKKLDLDTIKLFIEYVQSKKIIFIDDLWRNL